MRQSNCSRKTKPRSKKDTMTSDNARPERMYNRLQAHELTYVRKMGSPEFTVSTNVSGILALGTLASTVNVNLAPDFTALGGVYQMYRCRSIVVQVQPFFPVNTTAVTVPALIYVAPFYSGNSLNSIQGHIDGTGTKICSGYKGYTFATDYKGDLDSHLWTPTSAAIAGAEAFGFTLIGTNVASTFSTVVWRCVIHYIVEFRMMG
jgi:hypothetical protein